MFYVSIRARDERDAVVYEKDIDAGVFWPVATLMSSSLCQQNLMADNEAHCLSVLPRYEGKPEFEEPTVLAVSPTGIDWDRLCGASLVLQPGACQPETPVTHFVFMLFTQGRRCCRWDLRAEQLEYLRDTVRTSLVNGGYMKSGEYLRCEFLIRTAENPTYDERIFADEEATTSFRVLREGSSAESFPVRQLTDFDCCELVGEVEPPDYPVVVIDDDAFEKIMGLAREGEVAQEEVAGLLIGQPYRRNGLGGFLVHVQDVIPAIKAPATIASVRFTHDVLQTINETKDQLFPNLRKVGWYHSHPPIPVLEDSDSTYGRVFFSKMDQQVHDQFREPWHVALVVMATGRYASFFRWADQRCDRIIECRGFYVSRSLTHSK